MLKKVISVSIIFTFCYSEKRRKIKRISMFPDFISPKLFSLSVAGVRIAENYGYN